MENQKQELVITRTFDAPRESVWKAWSVPEKVKLWWGPKIFTAPTAKIDFRVGGKYLFCMRSDSGPEIWQKGIWSTGTFKEIKPMEKIVLTDHFADEQGNIVSPKHYGMEDFPSELQITLLLGELEGGKTKMTLKHEGIPEKMMKECSAGWNESFDKLAASLKK